MAIVQSSYIPWRGYFDLIGLVDEFILLDDVQYTRRDWRSRNRIKLGGKLSWLTVPTINRGNRSMEIRKVRISDSSWARRHWETLRHAYSGAEHFDSCRAWLEELYTGADSLCLSEINWRFLSAICKVLGLSTPLTWSFDYGPSDLRTTDRLVELCQRSGARHYLSGPTARAYIDQSKFDAAGISITWMDYSGYPDYPQLDPPFQAEVSILDLLFNTGPEARRFLKS